MPEPPAGYAAPGELPTWVHTQAPIAEPKNALLSSAYAAFSSMQRTRYQHRSEEQIAVGVLGEIDSAAGTYYFDCVGFAAWLLRTAAPQAADTLYQWTGVSRRNLPGPSPWRNFLDSVATGPNLPGWERAESATPGTVLSWPLASDSSGRKGHWVLVVSDPLTVNPGVELVAVMDSAIAPHGPLDTRNSDSRCEPADDGRPSGLGIGTMALLREGDDYVGLRWAPHSRDVRCRVSMGKPTS